MMSFLLALLKERQSKRRRLRPAPAGQCHGRRPACEVSPPSDSSLAGPLGHRRCHPAPSLPRPPLPSTSRPGSAGGGGCLACGSGDGGDALQGVLPAWPSGRRGGIPGGSGRSGGPAGWRSSEAASQAGVGAAQRGGGGGQSMKSYCNKFVSLLHNTACNRILPIMILKTGLLQIIN